MAVTLSSIGSCFVGSRCAYIYILYSKTQHSLYVGQTNDRSGVIGRLCAHVSANGTFRMRLFDLGIHLDEIDDLNLFSYCLPKDPRFISIDRAYREGVEYLVQKKLHTARGQLKPYMRIVSHVDYNDAAQLTFITVMAEDIFEAFLRAFSKLGKGL